MLAFAIAASNTNDIDETARNKTLRSLNLCIGTPILDLAVRRKCGLRARGFERCRTENRGRNQKIRYDHRPGNCRSCQASVVRKNRKWHQNAESIIKSVVRSRLIAATSRGRTIIAMAMCG